MERDRSQERAPPLRAAVAAVLVLLGTASVVSRATALGRSEVARNDFTQDYVSARAWRDGADPYGPTAALVSRYLAEDAAAYEIAYERRTNPHTPFEIVALSPLSFLPFDAARAVWLVLSAALIAAAVALFLRGIGWSATAAAVVGIGVLALPVAQKELIYGQTNALLLLLIVAGWRLARARREVVAGVALGAAAAIKLFPALLVIPVFRRHGVRAAAVLVVSAVVLALAGVGALGTGATDRFATQSAPDNYEFWRGAPMNLSLTSVPFRWLTHGPWHAGGPDLPVIAGVLAAAVGVACVLAIARTRARASGDLLWAAVPWMLLAAPLTWEFSLVLAIPFLVLVLARSRPPDEGGLPSLPPLGPTLAAIVVSLGIPPGLPVPGPTNGAAVVALGYALPAYALLFLAARDAAAAPS